MSRFGLRTFQDGQVDLLMKRSPSTGQYRVRFYDIDGTVLKEQFVNEGNDASPPETPNIDPTYLVFAEWNQDFTNVDRDLEVGAMYDTIDGKTYIFIRLTDTTGLQPTLDLNKTTGDTLTVDWGDSTTDTTSTNGNQTVQKTAAYAAIGDYVISIDCAGEYRNRTTSTSGGSIFGAPLLTAAYRDSVLKFYMGNTMTFVGGVFNGFRSMSYISMFSVLNQSQHAAFGSCFSLTHCNIPKNSTRIPPSCFISSGIRTISFPPTVTEIFNNAFQQAELLEINLKNITTLGASSFNGSVLSFGDYVFPQNITSAGANIFQNCLIKSVSFKNSSLTAIGNNFMNGCRALRELEFPASLTSIGSNAFSSCSAMLEYTFLSTTPPSLANTNAFSGIIATCKIYVPDASVDAYKEATNWITRADRIFPLSTRPCK
jgi:hypothetical protein